ncbi:MAG: helix-turn-helix domain-containing protein [Streptosporangiales bacterium]|nr:helix-turn-helix domain-containing protein [Streptosporangiales bacterium]
MRTLETVDRALQLLALFEQPRQELTVGALAAKLGVHRSGASRLAGTLAERGFLERSPHSDAYRLGPQLRRLGMLAVASSDLVAAARPVMAKLADRVDETVVLSVLDGHEAVDVAQVDGSHLIGAKQWVGQRSPLHATSDGKIFLAFCAVDLDLVPLTAVTERTITERAEVEAEVQRVRARGWAGAEGEMESGLNGAAAPIRDHQGGCVAALSMSAPEYRLPAERLPVLGDQVRTAADEVAATLGYVPQATDDR